jgi:hypothetical protein
MAFFLEIDGFNLRLMPLYKRCMELADVIAPHGCSSGAAGSRR